MSTVARCFTVTAPPPRVDDYLKDFANTDEWDPGTQKCTRRGDGQIGERTSWHDVSKIFGVTAALTCTLAKLTKSELASDTEEQLSTVLNQLGAKE
jgi:polyketide cyclase/dehydrase/lipid transport protein